MNSNNSIINNYSDTSSRLMLRISYTYFFIFNFLIQTYMINLINNNYNYDLKFQNIYSINYYLIIFINLGYIMNLLLVMLMSFDIYYSSYIEFLKYFICLTDTTLRFFCTLTNSTVIFEPEFQFLTFYVWNITIILNLYFNYLLNYFKDNKKIIINRIPGKRINNKHICCSICLNNNSNWKLPCQHTYHLSCIEKWYDIKKNCPLCRQEF